MIPLRTLVAVAETGVDETGECAALIEELEARYSLARMARLEVIAAMRHEGSGGRPTLVPAYKSMYASTVNGADTSNATDRWTPTKRAARFPEGADTTCYRIVGLPLWLATSFDTDTLARVFPLNVEPMPSAEKASKTRKRAVEADPEHLDRAGRRRRTLDRQAARESARATVTAHTDPRYRHDYTA